MSAPTRCAVCDDEGCEFCPRVRRGDVIDNPTVAAGESERVWWAELRDKAGEDA